jgi:predicted nuclease with TOPRIM domain
MEQKLDMEHRMTAVEDRSKSNTLRLNRLEENTAVLNRLATAVEVMATKQDTMGESVERLETKVDTLESKPGKRWDGLVDKLILTVAAALIGFLLAQLGVA